MLQKTNHKITKKSAFTLVELSVVLAIIAVVVAAVTSASYVIDEAKLTAARAKTIKSNVNFTKNLVLWLDATSSKSLAENEAIDGRSVSSWKDINPQTENLHEFTEATNHPIYVENGVNGLPGIKFDGTKKLTTPHSKSLAPTDDLTLFFVFSRNTKSETHGKVIMEKYTSGIYHYPYWINITSTTNSGAFVFWRAKNTVQNSITSATNVVDLDTGYIVNIVISGTNIKFYENGGNPVTDTTFTQAGGDASESSVTIGNSNGGTNPFGGNIGEIIMFNRALKETERKSIEEYLSDKWGIALD